MNTDNWITAVMSLRQAQRVVVFTGAGVSAESGIPTFRDTGGFWERFPPEQFAHWSGLLRVAVTQPRRFAEFLLNVIEPVANAEPNAAHYAIAALEQYVPTTVVTQNIDGLHQSAGSSRVLEIHGTLLEIADSATGEVVHRFERAELREIAAVLRDYSERKLSLVGCLKRLRKVYPFDWRGRHRPNLVLFGDAMAEPAWSESERAAKACDVLLAVGTSGMVYPAALLPFEAQEAGATVVSIDPQPNGTCGLAGTAAVILPKLVRDAFPGRAS